MKKILIIMALLLFAGAAGVFAVDVTASNISGTYNGLPFSVPVPAALLSDTETQLAKFDNMDKAAEAFGNAASYASDGANQRGLMGYKFLTIAVGTMVGFQAPGSGLDAIGDYVSQLETEGDTYFGAGLQALTVSVGLNSSFLLDGLYLSAKVGKFTVDTDDIKYDSFNFGLLANYQLVDPFSIGVVKWRGLQVGSGFIYYNSTADMTISLDPVQNTVDVDPGAGVVNTNIYLDPTLNAEITSSGLKMPVDILSGIRLLWIANLNFGIGADLNLASDSEVALSAAGKTTLDTIPLLTYTPGSVSANVDEGSGSVDFIKLRAMFGLGFALGPLKLDIPFTYYFDGTGFANNIGITGALTL